MKDKEISENNHPVRYGGDTEYECIKVLKAWLNEDEYKGFLKGNAIKYLCRLGKKDSEKNELEKSMWYINKLMEEVEEKEQENENRIGYKYERKNNDN